MRKQVKNLMRLAREKGLKIYDSAFSKIVFKNQGALSIQAKKARKVSRDILLK